MAYTQAPHLTDKEVDNFLKEAPTTIICSINEDNSIHGVPVWFKYESGQFLLQLQKRVKKLEILQKIPMSP